MDESVTKEFTDIPGLFNKDCEQFWKKSVFSKLFNIHNHVFDVFTIKCNTFFPTPLPFIKYVLKNLFHTKHLKVSAAPNAANGNSKWQPLRSLLLVGNRKKSQSARNHFHTMRGKKILNTRTMCGCMLSSCNFIDHYDNVVTYSGYVQ